MKQTQQVIQTWIDAVNIHGRNLTKWETDFMDSITEQFEQKHHLTDFQIEKLEDIYTEKVK